jgi:hypothetical protein
MTTGNPQVTLGLPVPIPANTRTCSPRVQVSMGTGRGFAGLAGRPRVCYLWVGLLETHTRLGKSMLFRPRGTRALTFGKSACTIYADGALKTT